MNYTPEYKELDYPSGNFWVKTDDDPHGKLYLVTPGGQLIDVGCHADPAIDVKRAQWMADALNVFRTPNAINIELVNKCTANVYEAEPNQWTPL